jgi:hypothetical protein
MTEVRNQNWMLTVLQSFKFTSKNFAGMSRSHSISKKKLKMQTEASMQERPYKSLERQRFFEILCQQTKNLL